MRGVFMTIGVDPVSGQQVLKVGRCRLTLSNPGTKRLKPECDEPLSRFAFKLKLRRYVKRVRFSRRKFSDGNAQGWWETNRVRIIRARGLKLQT
jgi:hypothetical protein